jgi:hypothetical protein
VPKNHAKVLVNLRSQTPKVDLHDELARALMRIRSNHKGCNCHMWTQCCTSRMDRKTRVIRDSFTKPPYRQQHRRRLPCSPVLSCIAEDVCCTFGSTEGASSKYSSGTKSSSFVGAPAVALRCRLRYETVTTTVTNQFSTPVYPVREERPRQAELHDLHERTTRLKSGF